MLRNIIFTFLILLGEQVYSASLWQGYVNEKSVSGHSYGYIANDTMGINGGYSLLRLVCFRPHGFRIYLDERILNRKTPTRVISTVDNLPPITFPLYQHGRRVFISDQSHGFWDLIAQLIAGVSLRLSFLNTEFDYDLKGFTSVYLNNCGWMENSNNYKQHIGNYR